PEPRGGLPDAHRGAAGMRLFRHELKGELLLYTRSRELAFFTFLLPMIFFLLLASVYGNDRIKSEGNVRSAPFLEAGMLGYGAISFCGLGIGLSALIKSAEGASAVVNAIYLPSAFISGSFFSPHSYPGFLRAIADVLPLTYFLRLVRNVMLHGHEIWSQGTNV